MLPRPISRGFFPKFSSRIFTVSGLTFKFLTHFESIFVGDINRGPISLICMWISSFPSTIYWKDYLFLIEYFWFPHQILVNHACMGLFLGFLFHYCSMYLFLWQYHTVLITIAWNQEVWCLLICSSFSRSLWLFWVSCCSIQILGLFFLFLWKMLFKFW